MTIRVKRAYDEVAPDDGCRVLVDRVWPRGIRKEQLRIERWLKGAAPSSELRRWFGHDSERWQGFKERYFQELDARPDEIAWLLEQAQSNHLTLVFAAKDRDYNNAVALKEYLDSRV